MRVEQRDREREREREVSQWHNLDFCLHNPIAESTSHFSRKEKKNGLWG